jgi:Holliday junction resolvase RusA-like endonuclease
LLSPSSIILLVLCEEIFQKEYKQAFRDEFNAKYANLYSGLPYEKDRLQSCIVYIHQLKPGCIPDVDNLSKPIVDSFTGVMYKDDSQIIKRSTILSHRGYKRL